MNLGNCAVEFTLGKRLPSGEVEWITDPQRNLITDLGFEMLNSQWFANMTNYVFLGTGSDLHSLKVSAMVVGSTVTLGEAGDDFSGYAINGKDIIFADNSRFTITGVISDNEFTIAETASIPKQNAAVLLIPDAALTTQILRSNQYDVSPGANSNSKLTSYTDNVTSVVSTRSVVFDPMVSNTTLGEIGWGPTVDGGSLFGKTNIDVTYLKDEVPYIRVSLVRLFGLSPQDSTILVDGSYIGLELTPLWDASYFDTAYYSTIGDDGVTIPPSVTSTLFEKNIYSNITDRLKLTYELEQELTPGVGPDYNISASNLQATIPNLVESAGLLTIGGGKLLRLDNTQAAVDTYDVSSATIVQGSLKNVMTNPFGSVTKHTKNACVTTGGELVVVTDRTAELVKSIELSQLNITNCDRLTVNDYNGTRPDAICLTDIVSSTNIDIAIVHVLDGSNYTVVGNPTFYTQTANLDIQGNLVDVISTYVSEHSVDDIYHICIVATESGQLNFYKWENVGDTTVTSLIDLNIIVDSAITGLELLNNTTFMVVTNVGSYVYSLVTTVNGIKLEYRDNLPVSDYIKTNEIIKGSTCLIDKSTGEVYCIGHSETSIYNLGKFIVPVDIISYENNILVDRTSNSVCTQYSIYKPSRYNNNTNLVTTTIGIPGNGNSSLTHIRGNLYVSVEIADDNDNAYRLRLFTRVGGTYSSLVEADTYEDVDVGEVIQGWQLDTPPLITNVDSNMTDGHFAISTPQHLIVCKLPTDTETSITYVGNIKYTTAMGEEVITSYLRGIPVTGYTTSYDAGFFLYNASQNKGYVVTVVGTTVSNIQTISGVSTQDRVVYSTIGSFNSKPTLIMFGYQTLNQEVMILQLDDTHAAVGESLYIQVDGNPIIYTASELRGVVANKTVDDTMELELDVYHVGKYYRQTVIVDNTTVSYPASAIEIPEGEVRKGLPYINDEYNALLDGDVIKLYKAAETEGAPTPIGSYYTDVYDFTKLDTDTIVVVDKPTNNTRSYLKINPIINNDINLRVNRTTINPTGKPVLGDIKSMVLNSTHSNSAVYAEKFAYCHIKVSDATPLDHTVTTLSNFSLDLRWSRAL